MAFCTLGAPSIRFVNLDSGRAAVGLPSRQYGKHIWMGQTAKQFVGFIASPSTEISVIVRYGPSSETKVNAEDVKCASKESKSSQVTNQLIPKPAEVESLLNDICDTSIAEFEMNLGGFHLHLTRDLSRRVAPPPLPIATTEAEPKATEVADATGSVSTQSLALSKPVPSSGSVQELLDNAADKGLVILKSPRVGFFRRSRTIKGKRAPPPCKEKQLVKEGKVICFIEQLGGLIPVESNVTGEVIKILKEDGEPIGYGDPLFAILPSFPGIKMLQ